MPLTETQLVALTLAGTIVLLVASFLLERTAGRSGGVRRRRGWDAYDALQKLIIIFGAALITLLVAHQLGAI